MSTDALLTALQWPTAHLQDKGKVTWSRPGVDADSMDVAMVLVSPNKVHARLARFWPDGPDPMHMEAIWDIAPGATPTLSTFAYAGEPQSLDSDAAVARFNELLQALNAKPAFQTMGIRWKDRPSASLGM